MGLRCLIGHDYAPPETEREREERGEEVVVTVREFKECRRCGERRTISENKEVRTTSHPTPDETEAAPSPAVESEDGSVGEATYDDVSAEEDDGVILPDGEEPERAEGEWPDAEETPEEPAPEPSEWPDDGPAEPESDPDHEPAAWPEREDLEEPEEGSEPAPWPTAGGDDEGFDAVAGEDSEVDDVEFGGGLTPQRSGGDSTASDPSEGSDGQEVAPAGITSASPGPEPTGPQLSDASADTLLVCPECGHEATGEGTSLRPGDICPECRRGYLTERGGS